MKERSRSQLVGEVPNYPEVEAWDREYAKECDRLAELEVVNTGKRHWGRWYLTNTSLETIIVRPKVGGIGVIKGDIYDIDLDRLNENWVSHIEEKNWIGKKGLSDLASAISALLGELGKKSYYLSPS